MRVLVRTVGGQRVESVGDRDDARQKGNFVSLQTMRITAAVERFVMQLDAGNHVLQLRHRTQDVGALGGVRLHDVEFFRGECARLLEDAVFDANFADIVQLGGDAHGFYEVF